MGELRKSRCQRVSIKYSVICATLGLAMALLLVMLIFGVSGISEMSGRYIFQDSSIVAIVTLYAAALILGLFAGGLIYRVGVHGPRIWLIGIGLAWSCLFLSVCIGSSMNFLSERYSELSTANAFTDWIIKPVFWVILLGGLPALGLGLFYTARVKKALSSS
jgi:hypothetical protein